MPAVKEWVGLNEQLAVVKGPKPPRPSLIEAHDDVSVRLARGLAEFICGFTWDFYRILVDRKHAAWQEDWDATINAAKNEGKLVIYTEVGSEVRGASNKFGERFGIKASLTNPRS